MEQSVSSTDFDSIKISIASPDEILDWSYGEITKPETINYRTQRPERDGLFDEKIFGPTKDYECYCGKYKKIRYKGVVCDKCGVEVTRSIVRRHRMGHIQLCVPIANIWYVRGVPSRIGLLLDLSPRDLERVIYFASFLITDIDEKIRQKALSEVEREFNEKKAELLEKSKSGKAGAMALDKLEISFREAKSEIENLALGQIISESKFIDLSTKYGQIVKVGIGAEVVREMLSRIDLAKLSKELRAEIRSGKPGQQIKRLAKKLKLIYELKTNDIRPEWMIFTFLPVIPPDLRPMVQLDGGRFAASDLNDLYRRVINRNNRLKRLASQGAPEVICRNEKRMLQEAVDALIDNSARRDKAVMAANRRPLKSLSDMLRGKQGRFRQNLLGKRVDYSGRSVIVVGPDLKLNQCGIPKVMALELFKPFVISSLISEGFAHNVKNATRLIEKQEPEVWDILEKITKNHYVLLNRAPTLHRLGIQGFQPVLIEGKAIQIHPLICAAYNADFDGDQMAVYVPLSKQARAETNELMNSIKNILKPAEGAPIVTPVSDMVIGCYYLTNIDEKAIGTGKIFASPEEAIIAHRAGSVGVQAKVRVRMDGKIIETTIGRIIFNEILPKKLQFQNTAMDKKKLKSIIADVFRYFGNEKTAEVVDEIKKLGFYYAGHSGMTFAAADIKVPAKKPELIAAGKEELAQIESQYRKGLITDQERYIKVINLWTKVRAEIEENMLNDFDDKNPIYSMVLSGSRGNIAQLTQIAGMKGLVANPQGEIIELPVEANYKEGFNEFEYFISTHGARKGRSDTALRTADAGYLTRRLVDVAQDVVVTNLDCGTKEGIEISKKESEEIGEDFRARILGRVAASLIKEDRKTLVKKDMEIGIDEATKIIESKIDTIKVYSVLTCKNLWGVCQKCYGRDLATGKLVEPGVAVGIIAAQAIGEPGTQLTMRTFHIGGIAGEDITSGLPRVEELFEARVPKTPAIISEIEGEVTVSEEREKKIIRVNSGEKRVEEYLLSDGYKAMIKNGARIKDRQIIAGAKARRPQRAIFAGRAKVEKNKIILTSDENINREYIIGPGTHLLVKSGQHVTKGQKLTEGHINLNQMLGIVGLPWVQRYIVREVQDIYASQGQVIADKHAELIVRQMFSRVRILDPGDTNFLAGQIVDYLTYQEEIEKLKKGEKNPQYENILLGITRVSLNTNSFLSAASFQETTSVLIEAATAGKIDPLRGIKENVIIGRPIPAGTGFSSRVQKLEQGQSQEARGVDLRGVDKKAKV